MRVIVNNLNFAYTQKNVLNNLSFSLRSGDFLTILGNNGSGKSTLLKCLLKNLPVPDNSIFLDDIDINKIKKFFNIGYVPQKADFNYEFPLTVSELLVASYLNKAYDEYYNSIINKLELNKFYHENINSLSGGQLQRVFIARALLNKPKLLVLDEPTIGVDRTNITSLINILSDLKKEDVTIILVTHDASWASDLTDYILVLDSLSSYQFYKAGENNDIN